MSDLSDDEIIAKLNANENTIARSLGTSITGLLLLVLLCLVAVHTAYDSGFESGWQSIAIMVVVGGLVLLPLIRRLWDKTLPVDENDPRFVRHRIDTYHRRWRWQVLLKILSTSIVLLALSTVTSTTGSADRISAITMGAGIVIMIAVLQTEVMAGPAWTHRSLRDLLDDDFIRALRARCARVGYLTQTLALSATYLIAIARPDLTMRVLVWALYAGFAIPALYYVIADWRAGREG